MKNMKFLYLTLLTTSLFAQGVTKRTLFIGNSYTGSNNLPGMTASAAASAGDVLIVDSSAPGGFTFQSHSTNATTLQKIALGTWDYVVLQEQSQLPSFPDGQVAAQVYPFAAALNNLITAANPCTETVFYMTWGRKNGDAQNCPQWPPVCTYEGMDDLLAQRYITMADTNDAILSPVGVLWRHLRTTYPTLELYVSDGSHPSVAGTYAAACAFYAVLFRKDPTLITFTAGLSAQEAGQIREAAKLVVFDNLSQWNVGAYDPEAAFTYALQNGQVAFANASQQATDYLWDFGDGTTSIDADPTHQFPDNGTYTVTLISSSCGRASQVSQVIDLEALRIPDHRVAIGLYPNPVRETLYIDGIPDSSGYQIFTPDGKLVLDGKLTAAIPSVPVAELQPGIYIIRIDDRVARFIRQ